MSELSINEVVKIVQELKALERKFGEEKGLINLFKKLIQDSSKLDESLKLHSLKIEEIVKYVNSSKNDIGLHGRTDRYGHYKIYFQICKKHIGYT